MATQHYESQETWQGRSRQRIRPVVFLLDVLARAAPGLRPRIQKSIIRTWYQLLSRRAKEADVTVMNFGYAPLDEPATSAVDEVEDEANGFGKALYHHVAQGVDIGGKEVLEVGCGRGGGVATIYQQFAPQRVTGVDFAENAVAFCRRRHRFDGLTFATADAESLPFASRSFDIVFNVESSHCYPSIDRFFWDVRRILRPQGYFLFTDFRPSTVWDELRTQLRQAGFTILYDEEITANVLRAMELDSERRIALARRSVPRLLQNSYINFTGVKGSEIYENFRSGKDEYRRFILQSS